MRLVGLIGFNPIYVENIGWLLKVSLSTFIEQKIWY